MTTRDHDYEPGSFGVCKRCGQEKHGPAGSEATDFYTPAVQQTVRSIYRRGAPAFESEWNEELILRMKRYGLVTTNHGYINLTVKGLQFARAMQETT